MGLVGYFTAEIGIWSELHTYSGGLGVLAGDHVKSAADAEINLIGVTLLYREATDDNISTKPGIRLKVLLPSTHQTTLSIPA